MFNILQVWDAAAGAASGSTETKTQASSDRMASEEMGYVVAWVNRRDMHRHDAFLREATSRERDEPAKGATPRLRRHSHVWHSAEGHKWRHLSQGLPQVEPCRCLLC